jgi:hypothetical protein
MSNPDNDEPPILAKFGSVIVDHEGSQLIKKIYAYIVLNCLICLSGVVVLAINGSVANAIIPVIFVFFAVKRIDELIKGKIEDTIKIHQMIWSILFVLGCILAIFVFLQVSSLLTPEDTRILPIGIVITFQLLPMLLIYYGVVLLIRTKRSTGFRLEVAARQKLYSDYRRWLES